MEPDAPYLVRSFRLHTICMGEDGVLNVVMSLSFVAFSLLFLGLMFVIWRQDKHRKTMKGMWRGLVFDKDQIVMLKTYFRRGGGLAHAAALALSGGALVVTIALAASIHGVQKGDCPASQAAVSAR
ncbi:hypothetical protein KX729_05755 [Rhizobium sp. XQZ8]|uniref:hypothetical protein n=1 Tax=Rhizobium populisoli TaxID=2859785 RepID=UPI001CA4BB57|nr:hypothetical protein [Rhizobium populisoli]MBW6420941.1 hypothetical protein [Rhizobium populisoli]